ncbi:hypothetical protein, partial [Hufsiella arboris]|uniref:hypothetical protein n=1 Tax=Hufsiella arboris TaxID=2695275 RepID=UPI001F2EBD2E
LDKTLNSIVIHCIILCFLLFVGLIIIGINIAYGGSNSGGMYGLYVLPLIPIVLLALAFVKLGERVTNSNWQWAVSFIPSILLVALIWLDAFGSYVFAGTIALIITYTLIRRLVD